MSWPHALGAFLGALCADAAGATLEFARGVITEDIARCAMRMPGGGIWRVGRGQITDDSELALALATALVAHAPRDGLPLGAVARSFYKWYKSDPYDIGNTCRNAFSVDGDEEAMGSAMVEQAARLNAASEANGSLMRLVPLAIWASALPNERLVTAAAKEATLSHPHQVCQDCNAVYCLLVAHLITHPGDRDGALRKAETFVRDHVRSVVAEWFLTASLDVSSLDCRKQIGHAILETLVMGGDTDTNAAIVGALMGALHGVDAIPEYMKTPVLAFDCTAPNAGQRRPAEYRTAQVDELTRALLAQAADAST